MSFRATIRSREKQTLWFKTISALSSLHENINFTLTSKSLIAWSMNSTDTCLSQAIFDKGIFDEFEFSPKDIIFGETGLQRVTDVRGQDHWLYSFQTNGKHLTTISKNMDNDSIEKFTLVINNTANCPENLTNRLMVSVEMETLIIKEYSPQFQPVKYDPIIINLKYKKKFLDVYSNFPSENPLDPKLIKVFAKADKELNDTMFNVNLDSGIPNKDKLTSVDEINYVCCHQIILRNVLENCNSSVTEELKLEININKFIVTAFTKAVYGKNNDLLRNAISMSNTISTSNLEHYCLFTTVDDTDADENSSNNPKKNNNTKKLITFKLKYFKNFLNILAPQKGSSFTNETINIWFCHPGDPILMEINIPGIRLELVQVTDGNDLTSETVKNTPMTISISPEKDKVSVKNPMKSNMIQNFNNGSIINNYNNKDSTNGSPIRQTMSPLKNSAILKEQPNRSPSKPSSMRSLFVNELSQQSTESGAILSNAGKLASGTVTDTMRNEDSGFPALAAQRSSTVIKWGKRPQLQDSDSNIYSPSYSQRKLNDKEALKIEKKKFINKLNNVESQSKEKEDNGLGPTQQDVVKGLFD
ncbi:hypothetical protein TPHA_0J02330 [Tetrapisispora phaffii CBS 4417]|uniref:DNA damage checkpoint protein 1 n=1 Tax=Tetrapisispora phaffii (strain ATCC 24235 / CBS 4417 / NBRC 1672 / NRRL Y-8282 / UCD 70-5) TaxID=1071381 RepID=G8BYW1_TETPH|nr:hypothetical protein TPHA_0J02330 [Tetrapisispora phaffii CBS 4417]CCE65053.1 hypothetical protein TPHA_0J02330 [Tetrapisispora phaffii CBS 4417]